VNLNKLGSALSTGAKSIAFSSCYMSVRTPQTYGGGPKSKFGGGSLSSALNKTADGWYQTRQPAEKQKDGFNKSFEIYSQFSKGTMQ
jgi:hypothetical protein